MPSPMTSTPSKDYLERMLPVLLDAQTLGTRPSLRGLLP